jgi:hypothetical protein
MADSNTTGRFVFGGTSMQVVHGKPRAAPPTIEIHASGPVDGMGEAHPEGDYVNLVIGQKDGSVWRFRISHGAAYVLKCEIEGVINSG